MRTSLIAPVLLITLLVLSPASAQNSREAELVLTVDAPKLKLATFQHSDQLRWAPLLIGEACYGTSDRYHWDAIPESLISTQFLVLPHHSGVLNFKIQNEGLVIMATSTRWNGGGNSSGGWKDEVLLEKDLRQNGWLRLRTIRELSNSDTGEMTVFYRYCEAGETHRIRTEKYAAPMLLMPRVLRPMAAAQRKRTNSELSLYGIIEKRSNLYATQRHRNG